MQDRCPGRPRDPETERRILEITLQQLASEGYSRMTLDAVAATAGVSKPTIYRRWSSKADLATAALRTIQLNEPDVDTGTTIGDLTATLENFCRSLMRPNGMSLIGTVLAEEAHNPELLQLFRERLVKPRRERLRAILVRAQKQGELRPGVSIDAVLNLMVGAFYARYLASSTVPVSFAAEVVRTLSSGFFLAAK